MIINNSQLKQQQNGGRVPKIDTEKLNLKYDDVIF